MKKYRFDNAYKKIYALSENGKDYEFLGSYYAFGITKSDSYNKAVRKVGEEL
jgi:hypothetical protein